MNMEEICRICLSSSVTLMDMFTKRSSETEPEPTLAQKIMECVRCAIKENDNLPQKICISCILTAETAFKFKRMCEQSHKILTSKLRAEKTITLDEPISLLTSEVIEEINLENTLGKEPESDLEISSSQNTTTSDTGERRDTQDTLEKDDIEISTSEDELANKAASKPISIRRSLRSKLRERNVREIKQYAVSSSKIIEKTTSKPVLSRRQLAKFKCPQCLKIHSSAADLVRHEIVHTDKRPHKCPHCSREFFLKVTLREHIRFQCSKKRFVCKYCSRKFIYNSDLGRHLRIHTGERPHECLQCSQKFARSDHLLKHIRNHAD